MKNCIWMIAVLAVLFPAVLIAQTDTVNVPDFFDPTNGGEGTLNTAVTAAITAGNLSTTVFALKPYGLYVLSATITVPAGKKLTLVAPDPGTSQATAPPMICWTPSTGVNETFNFDCYGDIYMKNIWLLYATDNTSGLGTQVGSALEIDQDTTDNLNYGTFKNVIFDYAPISNGGGSVTVTAAHARLSFDGCYFRNDNDTHFRYYGRAVSFPYGTSGWHIDSLSFVNTTFANLGYVLMQEGAEYADFVKFNHCTFLNVVMYTLESGWWWWLSVTNSVFVNPYMYGYLSGPDGTTPYGGTVNIDTIGTTNFSFTVPFTEAQRHIVFANNSYAVEPWLANYMAPYNAGTNPTGGNAYSDTAGTGLIPHPQPIMSAKTLVFFNNKGTWPYISLGKVYDSTNPGFLVPPTNMAGIERFLVRKWTDNSDTSWAFDPNSDINQVWPMNEQMRYSNATLKTAGMGGFPLGDLYRWWGNQPTMYSNWLAQSATENQTILNWLTNGITGITAAPPGTPLEFALRQNYPNPFNPSTEISFTIPKSSQVELSVYNVLGQKVATLVNEIMTAGSHAMTFDASNLASGVYLYRLQAAGLSVTKKMLLVK